MSWCANRPGSGGTSPRSESGRADAGDGSLDGTALIDSHAICEYFEETVEKAPMIVGTAPDRAEIRRLVHWFDERLHGEVVAPLMRERMTKRLVHRQSPDAGAPFANR